MIAKDERDKILDLCERIEAGVKKMSDWRDAIDSCRLSLEIAAQEIAKAQEEIKKMGVGDG